MGGLEQLLQALSAGSDVATVALAGMLLRIQHRIARLEFKVFGFGRGPGGGDV